MATISRFRAVVTVGRLQFAGFVGWLHVARRPPGLPDRVQEPRSRRWPTGPSRSSAAAGASARSPSSRCSPARRGLEQPARELRDGGPCDDRSGHPDAARRGRHARPALLRDRVRGLHHRRLPQAASERHQGRGRRAGGDRPRSCAPGSRRRPARRSPSARWRRSRRRRTPSATATSTRRSCPPRTRGSPRPSSSRAPTAASSRRRPSRWPAPSRPPRARSSPCARSARWHPETRSGSGVFMFMIVCTICGYLAPTILETSRRR